MKYMDLALQEFGGESRELLGLLLLLLLLLSAPLSPSSLFINVIMLLAPS